MSKMTITTYLNYIFCLFILSNIANCSVIKSDSSGLDIVDCGSISYISNLQISNCTETPCTMYIGRNHSVSFSLISAQETETLQNSVSVVLRGTRFDLNVTPNPCEAFICPLESGVQTSYLATLTVPESLLQMRADLKWVITDDSETQLVCFETPVVLLFP